MEWFNRAATSEDEMLVVNVDGVEVEVDVDGGVVDVDVGGTVAGGMAKVTAGARVVDEEVPGRRDEGSVVVVVVVVGMVGGTAGAGVGVGWERGTGAGTVLGAVVGAPEQALGPRLLKVELWLL